MIRLKKMSRVFAFAWITWCVFVLIVTPDNTVFAEEKSEIFVQLGHSDEVFAVAVSPDGRYALSGSKDNTAKLWELSTGKEIRTFREGSPVRSVAFSPDGQKMLIGYGYLEVWDMKTGEKIVEIKGDTGPSGQFLLGGRQIIGINYGNISIWDATTGKVVRNFSHNNGEYIQTFAVSPDGQFVASGGGIGVSNPDIRLWEVATGREVRRFSAHTENITALAFSLDGKYLLSGETRPDYSIVLWNVSTGSEVWRYTGHRSTVEAVAFSSDGSKTLSADYNGYIVLHDMTSGKELTRLKEKDYSCVSSAVFTPDNKSIISASHNRTLTVWDIGSGSEARKLKGDIGSVFSLAYSPSGTALLIGRSLQPIELRNPLNGAVIRRFREKMLYNPRGVFVPGENEVIGTNEHGNSITLWNASNGTLVRNFKKNMSDDSFIYAIAVSPDGRLAASGGTSIGADNDAGQIRVWSVATGKEVRRLKGHSGVHALAFSPDGAYLLSGGTDHLIIMWDMLDGKEVWRFEGHYTAESVGFSPDGQFAMSAAYTGIKIHAIKNGDVIRELKTSSGITSACFSPDSRFIMSGHIDNTMGLWDVQRGFELKWFKSNTGPVKVVSFSPDGVYALMGTEGGVVQIWNVETGREVAALMSFNDGEWITITPEGYYSASANGAKHLNVRIGNNVYDVDQFYAKFYRPELVQLALAGKELPKSKSLGDVLATENAPAVKIVSPVSGSTVNKDSVTIKLNITDNGGGIGNINIYLNGSQVENDTRGVIVKGKESTTEKSLSFTISLMDGLNEIKAVAMNKEGSMESNPAVITVLSKAVLAKPNLYALVVGINEYKNKSISLSYAVPDAKAFAETLGKAAQPLFGKTNIKTLTTADETTKDAVIKAFEDLRAKVKPNDLFVFYDASHGVVDVVDNEEQYFLLTSNVLLLSSRHIGADAISQKELGRLIGSIPAQKKLVILDTCNAGKGGKEIQVALLQQTRGLTDSTAVKLLQRAIGSAVFSASSDSQQALEGYKGHGLFTYVLMDGLNGKADVKKDGFITVLGLADYVEEEVIKLSESIFKRQQTPTIQTGANFPVGKVR